jgi:hypothetical protein
MKRKMLIWIGAVITAGGCLIAIAWWLVFVPMIEVSGMNWNKDRSPHGFWKQKQRALRLGWWQHDDGWAVGKLGGKEWMAPLIAYAESGKDLGCFGCHRGVALELLTNQNPAKSGDPSVEWPKWWAANRHKSQEDWILEGFLADGIQVSKPAAKSEHPTLLRLMGENHAPANDWEKEHPRKAHPEHLRFNAFRWLRDSGFDPVKFLLESDPSTLEEAVKNGVVAYTKEMRWLETGPVGRLAFAVVDDDLYSQMREKRPQGLQPRMHITVTASAVVLVVIGLAVIGLARRLMLTPASADDEH